MPVKDGDFVLLDYTGSTGGRVFDTTSEEAAKANGILLKGRTYRPIVVAAGKGDVIVGMDKALLGMEKGGKKKIKIAPAEGYGAREPKLVKVVPLKAFTDNKINPYPGMPVQLDNMTARVQSVSGGRVRVDFNHELAGRELEFEIAIVDVLTKDEDKIKALANEYFGEGDLKLEVTEKKIAATPKKEILTTQTYARSKAYFIARVTERFPEMKVEFVEEYGKA